MSLNPDEVYAILKKQIQQGGGTPGQPGVGIQSIEKTGTEGLVDTYTITYTNGTETTYTITNGKDGVQILSVSHGTSDTTFTLPANEYHTWDEVAALTITLASGESGQVNEYLFSFISGDTPTTLSLPEAVQTDIVVEPNTRYECSIVDNYMVFRDWEVSE